MPQLSPHSLLSITLLIYISMSLLILSNHTASLKAGQPLKVQASMEPTWSYIAMIYH